MRGDVRKGMTTVDGDSTTKQRLPVVRADNWQSTRDGGWYLTAEDLQLGRADVSTLHAAGDAVAVVIGVVVLIASERRPAGTLVGQDAQPHVCGLGLRDLERADDQVRRARARGDGREGIARAGKDFMEL